MHQCDTKRIKDFTLRSIFERMNVLELDINIQSDLQFGQLFNGVLQLVVLVRVERVGFFLSGPYESVRVEDFVRD